MSAGTAIAGRKKNTPYDLYETPAWATRKFLDCAIMDGVINKYDEVYECCCGAGAIVRVLGEYGFCNLEQSDIQEAAYISGRKGVDVYELPDKCCEIAFTNPPYDLMTTSEMLTEFLRISTKKVVLLLNIFYLSSKKRKELLENSPLRYVYVHSDRVTMFPYGEKEPENGGTKMFAWFVWEHGYKGNPEIRLV